MGRMKDIYTELQERGIDPSQIDLDILGELPTQDTAQNVFIAPGTVLDNVRNNDVNKPFNDAVQFKFQHAKAVLLQKHKDYGPKNISQSPGGPLNGLRVRMWDKLARINNLIDSGATPENESLKDSFLDLANYAIIAMLVLDNEWPNE